MDTTPENHIELLGHERLSSLSVAELEHLAIGLVRHFDGEIWIKAGQIWLSVNYMPAEFVPWCTTVDHIWERAEKQEEAFDELLPFDPFLRGPLDDVDEPDLHAMELARGYMAQR